MIRESKIQNLKSKIRRRTQAGATLIEILIGLLVVVIASIATLSYFAYGKGSLGRTGNRRAAMERARERLEQLTAADITLFGQPQLNLTQWVRCAPGVDPCQLEVVPALPDPLETVPVGELVFPQPIVATVEWEDDVDDGTEPDFLVMDVKVGFNGFDPAQPATDTDFNRVHLRTLRAP